MYFSLTFMEYSLLAGSGVGLLPAWLDSWTNGDGQAAVFSSGIAV